jgi:REase_MTES_1575
MQRHLRRKQLVKVWPNIFRPDALIRLHGLDLRCSEQVAVCLGSAAAVHGFDTQGVTALHVLNPLGHQLRCCAGLVVHRRDGVPLVSVKGRQVSAPAWTAIEIAPSLRRPRALATLDAALRSGTCDRVDLIRAAAEQAGRRGILTARELIPLARHEAESPMESEARLAMIDGGLPEPVLQYAIVDHDGQVWRLDFAWPDRKLAVEYDGFDWHSTPEHLRRDRQKKAALQELGWRVLSIVGDDVRRQPTTMVRRIGVLLRQAA